MMRETIDLNDLEPDIVAIILQRVIQMAPQFSGALAKQIEAQIKAEHGGKRVYVPKGAKHLTAEQRRALYQDGLSTMSNDEIVGKHKISLSTLKREMKRGGRFGI